MVVNNKSYQKKKKKSHDEKIKNRTARVDKFCIMWFLWKVASALNTLRNVHDGTMTYVRQF